ncbi:MAG TPA: helix-turn-helix domain-containing protein [Nitrososphaeraceae archaeon]|nr:helix-turn-helix domain-containing protein [Nitrososphaeraceae archaeon]
MGIATLIQAYRNEKDADVRERILLVTRVRNGKKEAASVAEMELHHSRWWAYKWLKRYNNDGLEGLKNKHRSGRPPEVSEKTSTMIRKELSENKSGWMAKEVMNLIYERAGVKYHEVHIYRLLHRWGFSPKVPQMRFVNAASKHEKSKFRKRQEE